MTNPINISSLDFQEIRTSLENYLKSSQSVFSDYPFDGSALSTLVDILSYNTLYYGYYSNMIANESFLDTAQLQSSVVSLLKPLGYTVNGTNCSRLTVVLTGPTNATAYTTNFSAIAGSNTFNFYPLNTYNVASGVTQTVELFEAASVISIDNINQSNAIVNTQKYYINDSDIDINTIKVTVNGTVWEKYNPNISFYSSNNKIYFIDRDDEGFYILFSRYTTNDVVGLYGDQIKSGDVVRIQYFKPSGSIANGAILVGSSSTRALRPSGGGGKPDLDLIKTFVPKLFSSSERAITKDDYLALLYKQGTERGLIVNKNDLVVWGGEEIDPPLYGRVFYSFNDPELTSASVKDITTAVREKGILTVSLEYVPAKTLEISVDLKYAGTANQFTLLRSINSLLNTGEFGQIFSVSDLLSQLRETFNPTQLSSLTVNDLVLNIPFTKLDTTIDLGTNISTLTSSTFSSAVDGETVYFKNIGNDIFLYKDTTKKIDSPIGRIEGTKLNIKGGFIDSTTTVNLQVVPTNKQAAIIGKQEVILSVSTSIGK